MFKFVVLIRTTKVFKYNSVIPLVRGNMFNKLGKWIGIAAAMTAAGCASGYSDSDVLREMNKPGITAEAPKPEKNIWSNSTIRLYNTSDFSESGATSNALGVAEVDGFGVGYERFKGGQAYGAKARIGSLANVHAHRYDDFDGGNEHEAIASITPFKDHKVEFIPRVFDTEEQDGGALEIKYRKNDYSASDNIGGGIKVTATNKDRDVSGYAWWLNEDLGLFLGAGKYTDQNRVVIGFPNKDGPTIRYWRLDKDNGFQLNELLVSTDGVNLNTVDFHGALNPTNVTDSVTGNGGVFRYIGPPVSARGNGITAGVKHIRTPDGDNSLDAEAVVYLGSVFVGGRYSADLDDFGEGRIGIPIGYRLPGGDGLTRNFIRAEPYYNAATNEVGILLGGEFKF